LRAATVPRATPHRDRLLAGSGQVPTPPGVRSPPASARAAAVSDHELIDVDGERLVRVDDVVLQREDDRRVVVGVEIDATPSALVYWWQSACRWPATGIVTLVVAEA
jgi:hypothetical protein